MHKKAIQAENRVNGGSKRVENADGSSTYFKRDGTKTRQVVTPQPSGNVTVTKTKIN